MGDPIEFGRGIAFTAVVGLILTAGAASAAPTIAAPAPRPPEAIYAKVCGYCHGAHVGPIIRGRRLPPEVVTQIVRLGPNAMPAFRPTEISDAELDSLARWVSTSKADPKEKGE
jgi:mono/diheme cytochrome c family protein